MSVLIRPERRTGARRMSEVPPEVLVQLANGSHETVNLMEWLAADMGRLARSVARDIQGAELRDALIDVADRMQGAGVISRLKLAGAAIARSTRLPDEDYHRLAHHRSDLVRQWACYAVNDGSLAMPLAARLTATLPFAADANMSVREAAWMAFRPHLAAELDSGLKLLLSASTSEDANVRRFSVEVTRPRSVWGAHIERLKREPGLASALLENVRTDPSRYVQLAVGNWLNDASKTRADWVEALCAQWSDGRNRHTDFMVRRGLRSIRRVGATPGALL